MRSDTAPPAIAPGGDGITIAVRVTPRSPAASLDGGPGHFVARLKAPPVEGAANAALIALVAGTFGVAKREVALKSGATGRHKRISIRGDPQALAQRAALLYGAGHDC